MSNKSGSFCVQNEIFERNISGNAKLVYTYLSKCADCFGKSYPSHKNIASACCMSVTAVKTALSELKAEKLISITPQYRENGGKSSNIYMIMNKGYKNAFWVMSGIFTKSISAKAKLVYMYFCRCSNQDGSCFPAHRKTSEKCDMALSTCRKAIKELINHAIIAVETRARKDNGQTSNLYTILKTAFEKVKEIVEEIEQRIENVKNAATELLGSSLEISQNIKTPTTKNRLWSYFSREHRQYIAGGLLKYAYERTILKLRKPITKDIG